MTRSVPYPGLSSYSVPQAKANNYQATPLCKKVRYKHINNKWGFPHIFICTTTPTVLSYCLPLQF
jgi:hypothetical protein